MLASPAKGDPPTGDDWIFEPKYDGIRIVALARPEGVALITRNGHDKARGFPEIASRLRELANKTEGNLVLDGEIVALDAAGEPGRFQNLQGRMHVLDEPTVVQLAAEVPTAYMVFDILVDGDDLAIDEPWEARRERLEGVIRKAPASVKRVIRLSDYAEQSANEMLDEAHERRWEGVMAKRRDSRYEPGRRTRSWLKLKLENQQEFVVGGWTEPRNTREHFGALLLGYYDDQGQLVYAGHSGGGFTGRMLEDIGRKLKKIERKTSPFTTTPKTNERSHWTEPRYVAQVKFNEWTAGGHLRQPIFLGLRDDKNPLEVVREAAKIERKNERNNGRRAARKIERNGERNGKRKTAKKAGSAPAAVIEQLRANPKAANLALEIDSKTKLAVTNLGKLFFPVPKITKGRLLEYYAEISPYLLPALDDRPLVLKRWPNGIGAGQDAFYQQKAPEKVPPGIRVEEVTDDGIETQRRLIGGSLATLLYIVQLGAISTDPWQSRVQNIAEPDYSIVDLDPGPKATFQRVINVARWVKEELDELGLHGVVKTSGASGIHVVLPLPVGATYEISRVLAELVARRVNEKHPKETTVQRWVKSRPPDAVYVDYLQNIRGKTVASVYSARAEPYASVSTPLKWSEITNDLDPRDFTVETVPKRLKRVGDLWATGMRRRNRLPGIIGDAAA
jgi:bifunctional non-homologous end joining protein LigD